MRGFQLTPTYIVPAARAVVFDDSGRILLIRRSDNHMWALPAGGMEPGESITECMAREVWEETGTDRRIVAGLRHLFAPPLLCADASRIPVVDDGLPRRPLGRRVDANDQRDGRRSLVHSR